MTVTRDDWMQADNKARQAQKNIASVTATIEQLKAKSVQAQELGIADICSFDEMIIKAEARLAKYQQIVKDCSIIVAEYKAQKNAAK